MPNRSKQPDCKPIDLLGKNGAGDGFRTNNFNLGKVALYP